MGRRKIEFTRVKDERGRKVCFKNRRIGLIKKAIQLSKLSDCVVQVKIYNKEDKSLVEYYSENTDELNDIEPYTQKIKEYSRIFNKDYDLISNLERQTSLEVLREADKKLEGYNMTPLFCIAKIKNFLLTTQTQNKRQDKTSEKEASQISQLSENCFEHFPITCDKLSD